MFSKALTYPCKNIKGLVLGVIIYLSFIPPLQATHIVGGEIYYQYVGNNRYKITLHVYRDCYNGIPALDDPAYIGIFNNNNPIYTLKDTLRMPLDSVIIIPDAISSPCLTPPGDVCYEVGYYSDTIILPPSSNGYWLVYQRCCRNSTIKNIVAPNQVGATYTAFIPGTNVFSVNSNPIFNNLPPTFICQSIPFVFDNSAYDTDVNALGQPSDSLVYSLCDPLDYEGFFNGLPQPKPAFKPPYTTVTWLPPYSLANLFGGVPMQIDAHTGLLTCTPNTTGQFVFGICVDEYRNGIYLSTTKRDYQINVVYCPNITVAAIQTPTLNCEDFSVSFTNQSYNAATYHWNFGVPLLSSDTSNSFAPTYIYPDSGRYNVVLVAYSGVNPDCNDSTIGVIDVYPGYKIAIDAQKTKCSPIVVFNDSIFSGAYLTTKWKWDFGDGTTSNLPDPIHAFPGPGTYLVTFTGTSNKGCQDTDSITIDINYTRATINEFTPDSCFNSCNGTAAVITSFGISPFTYQWNDPQSQTTALASGLCAGNYEVIVSDSAGCKDTLPVTITQPAPLNLTLKSNTDYCNQACVGSAQSQVSGGNGGYVYLWSDPLQQTTANATGLCDGLYTVAVTDNKGCTIFDTIAVGYTDSLPAVEATADLDTLYIGQQTTIHATNANGYIYNWSPSASLNSGTIPDPICAPLVTTLYTIQVTDSNGCKVSDQVLIFVLDVICMEPAIFVPNAFTPNNDNQNDVLFVRSNVIKDLYFTIYDRWGEKVFETTDLNEGWDGTYRGKKAKADVFDYYLKAVCYDKSEYNHKGNITLIR